MHHDITLADDDGNRFHREARDSTATMSLTRSQVFLMTDAPRSCRWPPHAPGFAGLVVRAGGAYILLGALGKTLFGTPADLPAALLRWMYWDHHALLVLVIAVEALIGMTAIIAPRLAWPIVMAALAAFMAMLGVQMSEGATSCGCFGSALTVPPWVMMVVDGALLALLALSRPWSALAGQPWRWWAPGAGAAAAVVAGLWVQQAARVDGPSDGRSPGSTVGDRQPPLDSGSSGTGGSASQAPPSDGSTPPVAPPPDGTPSSSWRLPARFPRYVVLQPGAWIDQPVGETVLATWVDPSLIPGDCDIVFFMETCHHCAAHLRQLAQSPPSIPLVLIQVPTPAGSTYPVVVDVYPEASRLRLPRGTEWHIQLPWHVEIRGGRVRQARYLGQ